MNQFKSISRYIKSVIKAQQLVEESSNTGGLKTMTSSGALTKASIIPRFNEDEEMKVEANHSAHDSLNSSHERFHSDLNLDKVGLDL